jgi:uncharacterized damage-inducible protein DinB
VDGSPVCGKQFAVSGRQFAVSEIKSQEDVAMKKTCSAICLSLLLAVTVISASAQEKKAAPKPPDSPSKVLQDNWNDIGRKLIAMAEDFPEDKYDFKPTPAQRTFAMQLLHAANANNFVTNAMLGQKPPAEEDPKREDYPTKAAVVGFVKKAFADGAKAIGQKGEKGLNELVVDPFANQQVRVSDMAWEFIEHSGEHYGQLVVYYRLAGLVPPESRPKK